MSTYLAKPSRSVPHEIRRLIKLAWPVVVAQVAWMGIGLVDILVVGQLSDDGLGLAAIGLGNAFSFTVLIVALGMISGLDPLLAQAQGAGDKETYARNFASGSAFCLWLGIPITILHGFAAPILKALSQPALASEVAGQYCLWLLPTVFPALLFNLFRQGLQSRGVMKPAMWVMLGANVLNLPLNYLFVHGFGSIPGMGAPGVGVSTLIVRILMAIALCGFALPELRILQERLWSAFFEPVGLRLVRRVALPVGFQTGLEGWAFSAAALLMGALGALEVAAHQVTLTLASTSFMVPLGISSAAASRVGNLIGAKQSWRRSAWTSIGLGATVMSFSALLFTLFPEVLCGAFTAKQPETLALAASLLPLAGVFQLFDGVQVVAFGVLRGSGDTRLPALANVIGYYGLGLPAGAYLSRAGGLGPQGIWYGLIIGLMSVSILLTIRVRHQIRLKDPAI